MEELSHLVMAAQQGNNDAFGQIVGRFQDMAFASAYALLRNPAAAQDAAQDAFIDAYVSLSKLREPAAFPGWFRRMVSLHDGYVVTIGLERGEVTTAKPGQLVPLEKTLRDVDGIVNGRYDNKPEADFLYCGSLT